MFDYAGAGSTRPHIKQKERDAALKICVVGLGYIGLPLSAVFADKGVTVTGVDIDRKIVDAVNRGEVHIEEPGLPELVARCVKDGVLSASQTPVTADVFIIAVPTPNKLDQHYSCDLSLVKSACKSVIPRLQTGNTVIVESTIAPGSMEQEICPLFERAGREIGRDIFLAHCPERILPGKMLHELASEGRIVGGITDECSDRAAGVYSLITNGVISKTSAKTAELAKCVENTFRDVNIAFANELAKICCELDINCYDVIKLANRHKRVNILQPGPGVGGHCLAVDPYFIHARAPQTAKIIKLSREVNSGMPEFVAGKAAKLLGGIDNPKIAVLGIAFKGNVDDYRQSPALEIIRILKEKGYDVQACDPYARSDMLVPFPQAMTGAHLALILTDHDEYRSIDKENLAGMMARPVLFDTRGVVEICENSKLEVVNYGNIWAYETGDAGE